MLFISLSVANNQTFYLQQSVQNLYNIYQNLIKPQKIHSSPESHTFSKLIKFNYLYPFFIILHKESPPLAPCCHTSPISILFINNYDPIKKINFIIKCQQTFKPKMEGQQIPKATMINFLKAKLTIPFSADFVNRTLILAKDYVNKLTEEANEICMKNDKKTINAEHIESALINFGLQHQLKQLKEMSSHLKQQNQVNSRQNMFKMKQQFKQRIQQNIEKNLQQIEGEDYEPRMVSIKQNVGLIQIADKQDSQQIDYEAEIEQDVEQIQEIKQKQKK